jgi:hypothetical protein
MKKLKLINGSVMSSNPWVCYPVLDGMVSLDGNFSVEDLEVIIEKIRECKKNNEEKEDEQTKV